HAPSVPLEPSHRSDRFGFRASRASFNRGFGRQRFEVDFRIRQHQGSAKPGLVVAPRLVVLGSSCELSKNFVTSGSFMLSHRNRRAERRTSYFAGQSSSEFGNTRLP